MEVQIGSGFGMVSDFYEAHLTYSDLRSSTIQSKTLYALLFCALREFRVDIAQEVRTHFSLGPRHVYEPQVSRSSEQRVTTSLHLSGCEPAVCNISCVYGDLIIDTQRRDHGQGPLPLLQEVR
jgi:hypothetical protein